MLLDLPHQVLPEADASLPRLLVVDDHAPTRVLIRHLLKGRYTVVPAAAVDEALDAAGRGPFDLFVLDLGLGEARTGIDLLQLLRPLHPSTPALAISASTPYLAEDRLLAAGFAGSLSKPFFADDLHAAVRHALHLASLQTVITQHAL